MKKRKSIVCIFAHPDDEAFGPSGTIYKYTKEYDVYLLCATKGQAGKDSAQSERKLEHRRVDELRESAKILGVKNVHFLGFRDGTLSNNLYHKLADKIQYYLEKYKPETIITFGPTGISGHLDHIAISMISSYVFNKVSFVKEMWQTVITEERSKRHGYDYFIFFPPGTPRSEVDKIEDVSDVWDKKVAAMRCHKSQKHDADRILERSKDLPKEEYFMVVKK